MYICCSKDDKTLMSNPYLPHGVSESIALNGGSDLLGAGGDVESAPGLEALGGSLFHERGHSAHVFVAGVGAGADKAVLNLQRPAVLLGGLAWIYKKVYVFVTLKMRE